MRNKAVRGQKSVQNVSVPIRTKQAWLIVGVAALSMSGCRAGKSIQDAEYVPYSHVAASCWQSEHPVSADSILDSEWSLPTREREQTINDPAVHADENGEVGEPAGTDSARESEQVWPAGSWSLDEVVATALAQNPEIGAARKEVEMARAKIPQVASLADPMLDVVGWPIYPNVPQTAAGRMTAEIMVSQEIPWFGKRSAKVGEAAREVNAAEGRLHAVERRIVEEVKQAYLDAWREKQTADFLEQDVNLLRELSEIITVMYETDRIGQQDLLRIKSEMGLAEVEVTKAQSAEVRTHAELVRAMHLPPDVPVSVEGLDGGGVFADDVTGLYQEAIAVRPELQVAWANIQRDQFRVEQARLNYYPDMNFRAGWGDMTTNRALAPTADGIGNISAGVSFNLPVQKARLNAAVFESESRVVAGVREWQSLQDATIRDVKQLHADIVNLQEQRQLYQTDILPQMEQAYEVTLGAYQVNEVAFSELIAIRRELLRLRLADLKLRVDIQKSLASLQRILARPDGEQHTNEIDD